MKSFEPVHGMSRVAKLIPDKLATAIKINQGEPENPEEDGSFMIDLVKSLLAFYRDQVAKTEEESRGSEANSRIFVSSAEDDKDFLQVLKQLSDSLDSMKQSLKRRQRDEINKTANEIVEMTDDILTCCYIYMDFVFPVWINVQKNGEKNTEFVKKSKLKLKERLEEDQRQNTMEKASKLNNQEFSLLKHLVF